MTSFDVRQIDPGASYRARQTEIDAAIRLVLESGRYILGPEVDAFEREFAAYLSVRHAVGVANGTDALELALRACGIGAGSVVYAPSHTAVATVAAIESSGAKPFLVDIDPTRFTLDPSRLDEAIRLHGRGRSGAVVPVHLYGHPADMPAIIDIARNNGLAIVEDCAQSHGAALLRRKTGTWGDAAAFSFYPTKNLGALGDGGAIVTSSNDIAKRARALRQYGWGEHRVSETPGFNSRLDELQAAVLRVKLVYLDCDNQRRREIAALYAAGLAGEGVTLPAVHDGAEHVYHQYVVRSSKRDALQDYLQLKGIATLVHYPVPVHLQPAYAQRVARGGLTFSERAAGEALSLPMYPELQNGDVERVVEEVRRFCQRETRPLTGFRRQA
ncbi:MAG TPA: DegT/DnrJ/EryC1/StrS family aminotransferase [Casimicrobiaceae bacterium]|nr:DegT/DnrJ/EryC1/StrS family aminotransferase [Casimicrobiaceae bacterium]